MTSFARTLALSFLLAVHLAACGNDASSDAADGDGVISVSADDAEMNAAIAKARATLPDFWKAFDHPSSGDSDFALKVRIADGDAVEHFWLVDLERADGKVFGTLGNDPQFVTSVKIGDRLEIPEADISDWLFLRNGKMVGNQTIRPLLKRMPKDEADAYRSILAEP
jgi:uncharacterized protein YegJ (DUF2314 family)